MKLNPGNIWSGSRTLAVFTNSTELAFRKGNLKNHYPVTFRERPYPDSEALYQHLSAGKKANIELLYLTMNFVLTLKLDQYPILRETIADSGGLGFLQHCSHVVTGKALRWEGHGTESGFIRCLIKAY